SLPNGLACMSDWKLHVLIGSKWLAHIIVEESCSLLVLNDEQTNSLKLVPLTLLDISSPTIPLDVGMILVIDLEAVIDDRTTRANAITRCQTHVIDCDDRIVRPLRPAQLARGLLNEHLPPQLFCAPLQCRVPVGCPPRELVPLSKRQGLGPQRVEARDAGKSPIGRGTNRRLKTRSRW